MSETMAWRVTFVRAVMLLSCGWITNAQYEDISNISIRATKISDTEFDVQEAFSFALFPSLKFTCETGHVVRFWFIGRFFFKDRFRSGSIRNSSSVPTIRLRTINSTLSTSLDQLFMDDKILNTTVQSPPIAQDEDVNQLISVEPLNGKSFNFTSGDYIGIMNPDVDRDRFSLLYHKNGGPLVHFQERVTSTLSEPMSNDYPLLAVETMPQNCASGFLSLNILRSLMMNISAYPPSGQYIIPALSLMCTRQSVMQVQGVLVGELKDTAVRSRQPSLQITWWRSNGTQTYNLTAVINITNLRTMDGNPNTYFFESNVSDGLNVMMGDVLGIRFTSKNFQLYYDSNRRRVINHRISGSINLVRIFSDSLMDTTILGAPLLSSIETGSLFNNNCSNRLPRAMDLYLSAFLINRIIYTPMTDTEHTELFTSRRNQGYIFFFNRNSFKTAGSIISWVFAAKNRSARSDSLLQTDPFRFPQLQIWKSIPGETYHLNFTTRINTLPPILLGALNMYNYTLDPPARYEENDMIGIYQPSNASAALQVAFVNSDNTVHQALVESTTLANTGTFTNVRRTSTTLLPLMTLATTVAIEPSQTYSSTSSVGQQSKTSPVTVAIEPNQTDSSTSSVGQLSITSTVAIEPNQTYSSTSSVGQLSNTSKDFGFTTPMTNPNMSPSTLDNGAVIGISVGVLGAIVLLILVIILMLTLYIAKKKSNSKRLVIQNNLPLSPIGNQSVCGNSLGNPTYTGGMESVEISFDYFESLQSAGSDAGIMSANQSGGLTATTTAEEYEVPSISLSHTGRSISQALGTSVSQDISQPYETPTTALRKNHTEKHIYHVLEASTENEQSYEVEMYVPSGDHRRVLSSLTSANQQSINAYATLTESQFSTMRSDGSYFVESESFWKPASDQEQLYHQLCANKYREISRHNIKITDKLGSGEFGEVSKGVWMKTREMSVDVAVKMLKSAATEGDRVSFLQEAAIMGQFRHPNIVTLMGVVTIGNPVMIVLEFLVHGDLRSYLNKQKPTQPGKVSSDWPGKLLNFCQHIAAGMDYLHKKGFIHRDLAARNILVAVNSTCKISDFGLSRDLEEENYYVSKGGMIPVKWTAPEALNFKKFSPPCDVWSYGIVMYEIWSLGNKPYRRIKNMEVLPKVEAGYRLPPPPGCPREIYRIMIQCWHPEGSCRPTFSDVLDSLLQPESELLYWKPTEDGAELGVHPSAELADSATLGAPLKAGEHLYPELQCTYMSVYEAASTHLQ